LIYTIYEYQDTKFYKNINNKNINKNINKNKHNNLKFQRNYSTNINKVDTKFFDWLRGFVDGEGTWYISKKGNAFVFSFQIHLHIYDKPLLDFICKTLGVGKVYIDNKSCIYMVSKLEEIKIIIDIFSKNPLNTTKYLNFLDFKEAFELYTTSKITKDFSDKIINLKNGMNSKRIDFKMPDNYKPLITSNWLLGFIEGEGSFSVKRTSQRFELSFWLSQSVTDEKLMDAIKDFLNNLANGQDVTKKSISETKNIKHKSFVKLTISDKEFINNIFIEFLASLNWYSKKELDFKDWVSIIKLKEKGHHYQEEGLKVLNTIINQMNNYRLSNIDINREQLLKDIETILNGPSNYEIIDGRKFIKSLNKFAIEGKKMNVQLQDENGNIIKIFDSYADCAEFLNISRTLVYNRVTKKKLFIFNNKNVILSLVKKE